MTNVLPSSFLDNSLKSINEAMNAKDYAKLQSMKVLDRDQCVMGTLNVDGEHFYFGGQLHHRVVLFNEKRSKRLMLNFKGNFAKIEDWRY